ncbi:uroporphyrinogen-III C-methyltransferase [Humibacillus sp. DSM 29435]|uniref:uroporphyrinogen-III C-methyltransferase n=1 Tax=Humibacillus sp. DSM 29435 TaxID=1869167 RepID=UPI0008724B7E|nr:uroporphyrinogen-III C-methyltransferase [Humibacillus sp. DSM 29435]OFE17851.1 uroporphyrinogen-III C-methyltransferase [Humibacillus sp. DSM 29435]
MSGSRLVLRDLSFRGERVLLSGVDRHTAATIDALLRDGAQVTIRSDDAALPTSVLDLVERGLVSLDENLAVEDEAGFTVVIRAGRGGHTTSIAATTTSATSTPAPVRGTVTLVGGGPGDPGLITVAGLEALRTADVIVHDRLVPLAALSQARPDAIVVDVGKIPRGTFTPQERINTLIVEHARAGRCVVRFKGGDNFVFGRGGEEAEACGAAGIPVVVVPGVTSSVAGPALAGIPLTHRTLVQGFTVVSAHVPPHDPRSTLDWSAIARANTTIVVLMGVATLPAVTAELVTQGLDPSTPAAVVADAGLPSMRTVRATVADIAGVSAAAGLGAPAVVVIGAVAALDVTS